jgi:hypothetical protein
MATRSSSARSRPSGRQVAAFAVLAVVAGFFAVPIVWLLLQPSNAVVRPWSFGSFDQFAQTWDEIFASH